MIVDKAELSHTINLYGCKNVTVQVKGKVNAVTLGKLLILSAILSLLIPRKSTVPRHLSLSTRSLLAFRSPAARRLHFRSLAVRLRSSWIQQIPVRSISPEPVYVRRLLPPNAVVST